MIEGKEKKGRVEVEKGENDTEQRVRRRERKRSNGRRRKGEKRGKRQKIEIKGTVCRGKER